MPGSLKLLWTYEAGDAIESSAAIVDGVVYVGSQTGELHAVNLADGKLKWKYKASTDGIGESSPTVAGELVYVGDLAGVLHAVQTATGQAVVDVQDEHGDQIVAGRLGRQSADRVLRFEPVRAWRERRQAGVEDPDRRLRARHAGDCRRHRLHRRMRRDSARHPHLATASKCSRCRSAPTPARRPAIVDGRAYFGTYENDVLAVDLKAKKIVWSYKHPDRNFPFYSSPAVLADRVIVGGRDKMVHGLDRKTGKSLWTFVTGARVDSSPVVAGGLAYIGSNDGKLYVLDVASGKSVFQFEAGGPAVCLPGAVVRPSGHRLAGRQAVLFGIGSATGVQGSGFRIRNPPNPILQGFPEP